MSPLTVTLLDVEDPRRGEVLLLAEQILNQDRYLTAHYPHARASHLLVAFLGERPVGFLRFLVQVIGAAEGRPPIVRDGAALTEAYIEAFGVDPSVRRRGIGSALQARAADYASANGCYQVRSRSPVTSTENYALKIAAGYTVSPSEQNDSYYFTLKLPD
jgi:GNAT superfamily N-acetyltransferase